MLCFGEEKLCQRSKQAPVGSGYDIHGHHVGNPWAKVMNVLMQKPWNRLSPRPQYSALIYLLTELCFLDSDLKTCVGKQPGKGQSFQNTRKEL